MATTYVDTGGGGRLKLIATEGTLDEANNRSLVSYSWYLQEYKPGYGVSYNSGIYAISYLNQKAHRSTPSFAFDWRPSGYQTTLILSASTWVKHNEDGSGSVYVSATLGDTGTSGAGGPTSIGLTLPLTKFQRGGGQRFQVGDIGTWKNLKIERFDGLLFAPNNWVPQVAERWDGTKWVRLK